MLAVPQSGDSSAVVDGGAGDDILAFTGRVRQSRHAQQSGDFFVLTQGTTRSAEVHNIETITILSSGAGTSGLILDASQVDTSISVLASDGRPDHVVGSSAGDIFETYTDLVPRGVLTLSGGADRCLFGRLIRRMISMLSTGPPSRTSMPTTYST